MHFPKFVYLSYKKNFCKRNENGYQYLCINKLNHVTVPTTMSKQKEIRSVCVCMGMCMHAKVVEGEIPHL